MILAYIFIIIGVLFFLKNAGIVAWSWGVVWPLLFIGLGVYIAWAWKKVITWFHQAWDKISKKGKENFFAGWRVVASGGAASVSVQQFLLK